MADSDSGGMGSSSPWWKSLMNSRKKSKEAAGGAQPAAQPAPGESQSSEPLNPDCTSSSQENLHPILSEDAGEPHKLDKSYGEKAGNSRRNLKISRSGRFKEKRKVRVTLLPGGIVSSEETEATCDPHEEKQ